jgi:hypothetical protein
MKLELGQKWVSPEGYLYRVSELDGDFVRMKREIEDAISNRMLRAIDLVRDWKPK